jgi:segregation and condensation protein B
MDYFGINTTSDLPKIKEVLADQIIEGTIINAKDFESNQQYAPEEIILDASAAEIEEEKRLLQEGEDDAPINGAEA